MADVRATHSLRFLLCESRRPMLTPIHQLDGGTIIMDKCLSLADCIASHFNGWRQGEHLFSKMPLGMTDLDGF
jgi:hypothetical protein